MSKPKLSVIVPVYNAEEYLENCLNSILNQSFKNFELIILDDGSTDKSKTICEYYSSLDARIKFFYKKNEGRIVTRNLGIEKASGDYITFVDNDDSINENYYRDMISIMESTDADMVSCGYYKTKDIKNFSAKTTGLGKIEVYKGTDILNNYFKPIGNDIYINIWTKIYKKELFESIKFENDSFEDLFIIPYILKQCKCVAVTDNKYYYYNKGNDNSITYSLKFENRIMDRKKYIDCLIKDFSNNELIDSLTYHLMMHYTELYKDANYLIKQGNINYKPLVKETKKRILSNIDNKTFSNKDRVKIILNTFFNSAYKFIKKLRV